jgi:hypothetical protein
MPLYENAAELIRTNLEQFSPTKKVRVKAVVIGVLTETQLAALNAYQDAEHLPRSTGEVLFHGWHIYKSRVLKDGYQIEDVIAQITSAMSSNSIVEATNYMTSIENTASRADRYGNMVHDKAVLECTARYPRPELYSLIPKGDVVKPRETNGANQ